MSKPLEKKYKSFFQDSDLNLKNPVSLRNLHRFTNFPIQVKSLCYLKNNWYHDLRYNHNSIIFSLFLNSRNGIRRRVNDVEITSRCPSFGFSVPGDCSTNLSSDPWDELYFSYPPEMKGHFEKFGININSNTYQEIYLNPNLINTLQTMLYLLKGPLEEGNADRIDYTACQVIMECHIAAHVTCFNDPVENIVREAASWIHLNYRRQLKIEQFLLGKGISYWTFLRKWKTVFNKSPSQYALGLKMEEAQRLLRETNLTIAAIAYQLHFDDPLYFSRLFRHHEGISPRKYRLRECKSVHNTRNISM